jgi:hypothetical protein
MFSHIRVAPERHPRRSIRVMADSALAALAAKSQAVYGYERAHLNLAGGIACGSLCF